MMKLVSNIFLHYRIYDVKESMTAFMTQRFRPLLPEKFSKKCENWCKSFFMVIHSIYLNLKKNSNGFGLVETAWNAPYAYTKKKKDYLRFNTLFFRRLFSPSVLRVAHCFTRP